MTAGETPEVTSFGGTMQVAECDARAIRNVTAEPLFDALGKFVTNRVAATFRPRRRGPGRAHANTLTVEPKAE